MTDTDALGPATGGLGYSAGYADAKREMSGAGGRDDGDLDALQRTIPMDPADPDWFSLSVIRTSERDQATCVCAGGTSQCRCPMRGVERFTPLPRATTSPAPSTTRGTVSTTSPWQKQQSRE